MYDIDFRDLDEPFEFIRKSLPNATEKEIKEAHLDFAEFLNMLWDMHINKVAPDKNCDKVESGRC